MCEGTVFKCMKKCKDSFKPEFRFNVVDLLLLLLKLIATLPLTSAEEWPRSLFYRNSSRKIQEIHFSYYILEG